MIPDNSLGANRLANLGACKFRQCAAIVIVLFATIVASPISGSESPSWFRILTDAHSLASSPGVSFAIGAIEYKNYTLSASCWYRYTVGTDQSVLHGQKEPDGTFRPAAVTYQVATEGTTKWKKLDSNIETSGTETITVSPENPIAKLSVNMEPFQKAVGVFRYGRLVLETGEAAIFALEDLLPTADARGTTNNFKEIVFPSGDEKEKHGSSDARIGKPVELFAVISLGDRLIGDFIVEATSAKGVALEGTRTLDGDFWPKVTLQAADSKHLWKTIGESRNNGTPATLEIPSGKAERVRVLLTDYRALIGKFKFGKLIFSDGPSGIFSMELLEPN